MSQTILFIKLLLVHYTTQNQIPIKADCNANVSLKCEVDFDLENFLSVTWYKLHNQKKLGIIRTSKVEKSPQYFNFIRKVAFGGNYSLFLSRVMPEDSGIYECAISANVGGQNQNIKVNLTVHVCATQTEQTTMTTVFNSSESTPLCHKQVEDLPIMWGVIGYMAVGFIKIILCLMSIWAIRISSSRRQQHMW